jgi:hypothetical protein
MASSKAATVDDYLAELPDDKRAVISAVRDVVNAIFRTATSKACSTE